MGPSSGLAAVAASAVLASGITSEQDAASFVAGTTLDSGILFLLLVVFRMGWIAQFLSRAVVTGFLFGAAIDVVIGELPKLTGTLYTTLISVNSAAGFHTRPSALPILVARRVDADALARDAEHRSGIAEAYGHRQLIKRLDTVIRETTAG